MATKSRDQRSGFIFNYQHKAERTRQVISLAAIVALSGSSAFAATRIYDGGPSGSATDLNTPANWSADTKPLTSDEAEFSNVIPAGVLTTTSNNQTYGDLLWNSNTSDSITINTGTATPQTITLTGAGGTARAIFDGGSAGDLLLMGTNATSNTLTIGGNAGIGTGRLNLVLGANGNFDVKNSGATLAISSIISGAFTLTKTGAGTLSLSGVDTYTATAISNGTVNLDFTADQTANKLSTGSLSIGAGTLRLTGGAGTSNQTVAGLTLTGGMATLSVTSGSNNNATLALGAITATAAGSSASFVTTNTGSGVAKITTSNANPSFGGGAGSSKILGAQYTFNNSTFAANDGSNNVVGLATAAYSTGSAPVAFTNWDAPAGTTSYGSAGSNGIGNIRFNNASAMTLSLNGGQNVDELKTDGNTAAFLMTAAAGTVVISGNDGPISSGGQAQNFIIYQFSTTNTMTLGLRMNIGGWFEKAGAGTLLLTNGGNNSVTGGMYLNGGLVNFNAIGQLSNTLVFNGGGIQAEAAGMSFSNAATLNSAGGVIDTNNFTLTYSGAMAGTGGLTKTNTGRLIVSGTSNTYTGGTTVSAGTLEVSGKLSAGHTTVTNAGTTLQLDSVTSLNSAYILTLGTGTLLNINYTSGNQQVAEVIINGTVFNSPITFNFADNYNGFATYFTGTGTGVGTTAGLQVVPEPTSIAVIGLGAMTLLSRRRRRT